MNKTSDDRWDERLKCFVVSLAYGFLSRTGRLDMIADNCCDFSGCLSIFEKIDPEVDTIMTYAGGEPDTIYRKEGKEWNAFLPGPTRRSDIPYG